MCSSDLTGEEALAVTGRGLSTDIIAASIEAYLIALNKLDGPALGDVSSASVRRTAMHNLT